MEDYTTKLPRIEVLITESLYEAIEEYCEAHNLQPDLFCEQVLLAYIEAHD